MSEENNNLFSENYIEAFNSGSGAELVRRINKDLGSLLASERSVFYVQVILRMLYFRREHEVEPLNDEIYFAVKSAQEVYSECEYSLEIFNRDIQQLLEWGIISRRIEKERLRGYRDISRQKFRYNLNDGTVSFLIWLEDHLHNDIEDNTVDTRNFLVDLTGRLKETVRGLKRLDEKPYLDEVKKQQNATSIIYNINTLDELTFKISTQLGELNARLLGFLFRNYKLEDAKNAVTELEFYTSSYLKKVDKLRREIVEQIRCVIEDENSLKVLRLCSELALEYYTKLPFMSNKKILRQSAIKVFESLDNFYKASGKLDILCGRINDTAMKVWDKLSAYLRELERKNTRLEDLKARMKEMAQLNEESTLDNFFFDLLASAQMPTDTNYWKEGFVKADPQIPRLIKDKNIKEPRHFFKIRKKGESAPVQSLEQFKLEKLKQWIHTKHLLTEDSDNLISSWEFNAFDDFLKIVELAGSGILNKGKKLDKINLKIEVQKETVEVELQRAKLQFKNMILRNK